MYTDRNRWRSEECFLIDYKEVPPKCPKVFAESSKLNQIGILIKRPCHGRGILKKKPPMDNQVRPSQFVLIFTNRVPVYFNSSYTSFWVNYRFKITYINVANNFLMIYVPHSEKYKKKLGGFRCLAKSRFCKALFRAILVSL